MKKPPPFVDRRRGNDRRLDPDPCKELPVDLYHRKRRKSQDRRTPGRTLLEDYYAYMAKYGQPEDISEEEVERLQQDPEDPSRKQDNWN